LSKINELDARISPQDMEILHRANEHLEHPSLAARLTSVVGTPIEIAVRLLPRRWYKWLHEVSEAAITKALEVAISSMRREPPTHASEPLYKALGIGTGAVGGLFGFPALALELPISTTIMLRSIADIARSEGEDLHSLEARMACLQVFALGGRSEADDAAETGYYGIRLAMALSVSSSISHLGEHGLSKEGGPFLVSLVSAIASRFGATVSEKVAAQLVPIVGAAGGAAINGVFMNHFQDMARNHFAVRRLERVYGAEAVRAAYESFSSP
jgi:hypothetical protein